MFSVAAQNMQDQKERSQCPSASGFAMSAADYGLKSLNRHHLLFALQQAHDILTTKWPQEACCRID